MGNTVPTLGITLNKDDGKGHVAGDDVVGMVFADVKNDVKAKELLLFVTGKEKCRVPRGKSSRGAERTILQIVMKLKEFENGTIQKGRYEFPFRFKLPDTLPSSMMIRKSSKSWSYVKYKMRAKVMGCRSSAPKTLHELLVTSSPLPPDPIPHTLSPQTQRITTGGGLISKGSMSFAVHVDDSRVGRGEHVDLVLACRNDSTTKVERIEMLVREHSTWKARGMTKVHDRVLSEIKDGEVPVGMEKKSRGELRREGRVEESYRELYDDLVARRHVIRLKIPENARDTHTGNLIRTSHIINIKFMTNAFVNNPSFSIPIQIGTPPLSEEQHRVSIPPPFNPEIRSNNEQEQQEQEQEQEQIPVATALPLGWYNQHSIRSDLVIAPENCILVGGRVTEANTADSDDDDTTFHYNHDSDNDDNRSDDDDNGGGFNHPSPPATVPSFSTLLDEMTASVEDYDLLSRMVSDPIWIPVLASLTPVQFGVVIRNVNDDFDRPRIAFLLAKNIFSENMNCDYCLEAIKNAATWNRTAMVQRLLPLCNDLESGQDRIKAELNQWELTTTEEDFEMALSRSLRE